MSRRDVDQEIPDLATGDGFQMLADQIDMPVGAELARLNPRPSKLDERAQGALAQ